ncbi:hypothetical protein C0J50_24068 [Silurus asotus]|uniref:Uncharacterized protein n=1 Tax=Silurus asotus TaxID=30991 RepID=A0AAD5FGT8_SILAS|nr:hypothetical protein C0J50_24068 [Silurus asotus]
MPDIGIDNSLMKYSGLNAAAELEASVSQVLSKSPGYIGSLGSSLSALSNVPNAVGLCAMVISILLDIAIGSLAKSGNVDNTLGMMRRVFAEEKASGVRDSMEEYIKRLGMYLHQPTKALEETERLERQLSEQLTRLKNSMLHDNQMSSRSMKHWTNGAAFHLQMLIHAARLKMKNTTKRNAQLQIHVVSIISVIHRYQLDLDELLQLYKTYKKTTITIDIPKHIAYPSVHLLL